MGLFATEREYLEWCQQHGIRPEKPSPRRSVSLPEETPTTPKPSKYRNTPEWVDGIRFDSKKEARRYVDLKTMERAGLIAGLQLQVPFRIEINGFKVCVYQCDFAYLRDGNRIVEDVKSSASKTRLYELKRKLMRAVHGIEIQEV